MSQVQRVTSRPILLLCLALAGAAVVAFPGRASEVRQQDPSAGGAATEVDLVAVDRAGRFVEGMGREDFVATVDGVRRNVLWVRRVSRGPGAAAEAAARQAAAREHEVFAAEPARSVLLVIDQASMVRGDEREVVQAAGLFLDRLGLNDRVTVVRIPLSPGALLNLAPERAELRSTLARVAGRLVAAPVRVHVEPTPTEPEEQRRMSGLEAEGRISVDPASPAATEAEAGEIASVVEALRAVFETLRRLPGRKVVAVFSAGVPASRTALVDETARAAAAARAVVYAFGARRPAVAVTAARTTAPLERLAAATGGLFAPLGRNWERVVERAASELGACYVLGLEPLPAGGVLRVVTTKKDVTVRAGGWLAAAPDAADHLPAPPPEGVAAAEPETAHAAPAETPRAARRERDAELQVALARLFDYAEGYERQYSMLVAEEDYKQSASAGGIRLRSDVLMVRPGQSSEWVSFRDVFEVDGKPVRDREERLRKLFLEATPDAVARLEAIGQESARYNIGWVERTANVPLLPLTFLRAGNRDRFDYELAGQDEVRGVRAWRVRFTERARPTVIGDRQGNDLPVSGFFLVDIITGAVVETQVNARRGDARASIVVRYRNEPALGLWVPAEMRESYSRPDEGGGSGRPGLIRHAVVEGRATYSNFRRFQVTTGETITPPK